MSAIDNDDLFGQMETSKGPLLDYEKIKAAFTLDFSGYAKLSKSVTEFEAFCKKHLEYKSVSGVNRYVFEDAVFHIYTNAIYIHRNEIKCKQLPIWNDEYRLQLQQELLIRTKPTSPSQSLYEVAVRMIKNPYASWEDRIMTWSPKTRMDPLLFLIQHLDLYFPRDARQVIVNYLLTYNWTFRLPTPFTTMVTRGCPDCRSNRFEKVDQILDRCLLCKRINEGDDQVLIHVFSTTTWQHYTLHTECLSSILFGNRLSKEYLTVPKTQVPNKITTLARVRHVYCLDTNKFVAEQVVGTNQYCDICWKSIPRLAVRTVVYFPETGMGFIQHTDCNIETLYNNMTQTTIDGRSSHYRDFICSRHFIHLGSIVSKVH